MTPSRYCVTLGAAAGVIAGAIALFNYAIDPYLLFDTQRIAGFNDRKPSVATREQMMKAYQAERVSARTIVLGSSRSDLGIDPAASVWPAAAQPVYNLSLVGSDLATGLKYLQHYVAAHPASPPRNVVVGLDFEAFLYVPGKNRMSPGVWTPSEMEERLALGPDGQTNPYRPARIITDKALGLLSLDALADSLGTIAGSQSGNVVNLNENGSLSEDAFRDTARADGFALLFDQKNIESVRQYGQPRRVLSDTPNAPVRHLDSVRELLAFARAHGMTVTLAIQPAHVSRLELLDGLGYWNDYERWKRELTALVAQENTGTAVNLWDFGGYEARAQETVPDKSSRAGMKWFWDPVHYSSLLGEVMLSQMFGNKQEGDFGVRLTPENIEQQLGKVRRDRDVYRAAMPEQAARLAKLACGKATCPVVTTSLAAAPPTDLPSR